MKNEYSEKALRDLILSIRGADCEAMKRAEARQESLAKPPRSLGRLEELSVRLAGMTGKVNNKFDSKYILVFCADNGVAEEGIASAPQSVTASQAINMTKGKTGVAVLAKRFGCVLRVCDVGINADIDVPEVIPRKIAYGTRNISRTAAMSREDAVKAILTGASLAKESADIGAEIIGTGEMGIGNTTTSSAVLAVLTQRKVTEITGRGAGITDDAYKKKLSVIETAISVNSPDKNDITDVISKVGGFDIAAMTGAFLGCAAKRIPVVIDGFISAVAALCAYRLCPFARDFMIPSHASFEIGYRIAMGELGLVPLFDLSMRLGEGSGCPIAMMMVDAACAVMNDMATFEEADINDSYLEPIRKTDAFSVKGK
jgi:nicotinate-nucleotide--dimethylbenzimidazole phosphoribosyltransferase